MQEVCKVGVGLAAGGLECGVDEWMSECSRRMSGSYEHMSAILLLRRPHRLHPHFPLYTQRRDSSDYN